MKSLLKNKTVLLTGTALVSLAIVGVTFALTRGTQLGPTTSGINQPTTQGQNPSTNPSTPSSASSNSSDNQSSNKSVPPSAASGTQLLAPFGSFVSNHNPKPGDVEQSTCTTTPDATCQISFSKNGAEKSLSAKTADKNGNVIWSWKPQDLGLTDGPWKITAMASSGDQSKSAQDSIPLQIQS